MRNNYLNNPFGHQHLFRAFFYLLSLHRGKKRHKYAATCNWGHVHLSFFFYLLSWGEPSRKVIADRCPTPIIIEAKEHGMCSCSYGGIHARLHLFLACFLRDTCVCLVICTRKRYVDAAQHHSFFRGAQHHSSKNKTRMPWRP